MLARREAAGLIVSRLDRLSRSVVDFGCLLEWMDEAGATLVALDLGVDTSSPGGRLVANVFASVAEWERATIAARTKAGLAAVRAQGKPISRASVTDRPELRERIAAMRAAGITLQGIADELNAERVPTLRGGSHWRPSSVRTAAGWQRPQTAPAGCCAAGASPSRRLTLDFCRPRLSNPREVTPPTVPSGPGLPAVNPARWATPERAVNRHECAGPHGTHQRPNAGNGRNGGDAKSAGARALLTRSAPALRQR